MNESKPPFPAFPSEQPNEMITFQNTYHLGMDLRDYFAACALPAVYAVNAGVKVFDPEVNAKEAYEFADAMLKARESA